MAWSVLGFCAPLFAANTSTKAPVDLRDQALQEIQQQGKRSSTSTSAQVGGGTGMLSLEDPMPRARGRAWDYFLRLSFQSYSPGGQAGNDLTSSRFNLDSTAPALMPALTFGVRSGIVRRDAWSLGWGLGARIGYTSEKTNACFSTGFCEKNAQLNTMITSGVPELTLRFSRFKNLSLNAGAEIGNITYTQTSGNKFASFNAASPYVGYTAGVDYDLGKSWSALFSYTRRTLTKSTSLDIQADNYELGTRLTW